MSPLSVFIFSLMCNLYVSAADSKTGTLRLVNFVYRHGDRTPEDTYPNNPNPENTTWPQGLGALTEEGMQMQYSLGRFIRRRYAGYLSQRYKNTEVTVQSSDLDRCLMSAYSNLAGLYPPSGDQVWNKNISWQPIPVHTMPKYEDNMLAMDKPCPKYDELYAASLKTDRIKKEEAENKDFYDFIKAMTGVKTESIKDIWRIIDTLYCEKQHNVSTPKWANDTVYERLLELWAMNFDLLYHDKGESRLKGGPLLKEWIRVANKKINDAEYTIKMNMYSAHDTTVVAIMNALQVYNHMLLPYTSSVIMELYEEPGRDFYVELYFRNHSSVDPNDDTQPSQLTLPGCEFQCSFDQFISLTKNAIPIDWDAECAVETPAKITTKDENYKTAFIAAVAVYSVVVLLLIVVAVVICSKHRRAKKGFDM